MVLAYDIPNSHSASIVCSKSSFFAKLSSQRKSDSASLGLMQNKA